MGRRKKTRAPTEKSLHLPAELIEEILLRLAVKSLLRLRCVSKSWLSLIDSKRFIKTHQQYSANNKDSAHHRVLLSNFSGTTPNQCSLRALLGSDLSPLCHPISPYPISTKYYNPCCCNGLVSIYQNGRFLLLNPSTRVSKELPEDPEIANSGKRLQLHKVGLGWDESSGAYKVFAGWMRLVRVFRPSIKVWHKARVYSSNTNSWKTVEYPYLRRYGDDGKFIGGKIHWLSRKRKVIISFDVKSEVFGRIELPGQTKVQTKVQCQLEMGVVGVCLSLTHVYYKNAKKTYDVWVMKESWEKLASIHLPRDGISSRFAEVIGAAANGEILIDNKRRLLVYCPRSGVIRWCRKIDNHYKAYLYVESLVSPVREITSLDI